MQIQILSVRRFAQRLSAGILAASIGAALAHPAAAAPAWMDSALPAAQRSALLTQAMTQSEKLQQLIGAPGVVPEIPACYGARHVPGLARLQIPTLRVTNGPVGVGQNDCVPVNLPGLPFSALSNPNSAKATALPSGMAVAASFDRRVAAEFGDTIGLESRALALQVLEGPGVNLARVPQAGRNFEYFGEDPFLTGTMAVQEIRAIQAHGVIAMAKHFVANEQETNRFTVNELIDDRVLHELYLLPFEMAVKDGDVAAIMCSYNSVNGPHACEDRHFLTDVLRTQWGFKGYVQSDFFAVHSTAATLLAGMDHEMPGMAVNLPSQQLSGPYFTAANLTAALDRGQITQRDIDTALARRYTQMFRLGIFDRPVVQTPIDAARDSAIARSIGERSAVLLKNAGGLLPLDGRKLRSVAVIGQADYAAKAVMGCCGGSSDVIPLRSVTPLQGLQQTLAAIGSKATVGLTIVAKDNSNLDAAIAAAKSADVVIVLAGTISEEGRDLPSITLPNHQDAMIAAVAAANSHTVVVLKDNAAALLPWIDKTPAVLEAWFPGQEDGAIVARLLFGLANPSGSLPVTFPRTAEQQPVNTPRQWPGLGANGQTVSMSPADNQPTTVAYSEGLQVGHRWFDAQAVPPLFAFGHGLSYTTFQLSRLTVESKASGAQSPVRLRFALRNTGRRAGAATALIYLTLPQTADEPPRRLVGFEKARLRPGQQRWIEVTLDPAAASHPFGVWDSAQQAWTIPQGDYVIQVEVPAASASLAKTLHRGL